MNRTVLARFLAPATVAAALLTACGGRETVSFSGDVQPLLNRHCLECHKPGGDGYEAIGFSMETYADLMRGTEAGPMVIAGDSLGSNLLVLIEGRADPTLTMPRGSHELRAHEIEVIRTWIDEGARDN